MLSRDEFIYTGHVTARESDSRFRLAQLAGDRSVIVDVGCAVGYIGEYLRRTPPKRWLAGIELDERAIKLARPHYDQLIAGSIEDQKVWDQLERDAEAMIFGDVLEHTADPVRVLHMAAEHLGDDGIVIISMPNIAHFRVRLRLLAGRFDYEEWGIMDRTHLRFFTLASARKMLRSSGFQVLHSEPILSFPTAIGSTVARRAGLAVRARVRAVLGNLWPSAFAKQFIHVAVRQGGRQERAGKADRGATH